MAMIVSPGSLQLSSLTGAPTGLLGTLTWRLVKQPDDAVVIAESTGQISNGPPDSYWRLYTAPTDDGVYVPTWDPQDSDGDIEDEENTIQVDAKSVAPSVFDVGALVQSRLKDGLGRQQETFTDDTRPTVSQVQTLITNESGLVRMRTGDLASLDCVSADDVRAAARQMIAKRVAAIVEASYRPEQIQQGMTVADFYQGQMDADLAALINAAHECRYGESPDTEGFASITVMSPTATGYVDRIGGLDPFVP